MKNRHARKRRLKGLSQRRTYYNLSSSGEPRERLDGDYPAHGKAIGRGKDWEIQIVKLLCSLLDIRQLTLDYHHGKRMNEDEIGLAEPAFPVGEEFEPAPVIERIGHRAIQRARQMLLERDA